MHDALRRARIEDLPTIWRGEAAYIREIEPAHEDRWLAAAERNLHCWINGMDRMLILEARGETTGYVAWQPKNDHALLSSIHVFESFRRTGRGKALLEAYINDALTFGFTNLRLSVLANNPARSLYERNGFIFTREHRGYRVYTLALNR